MAGRGWRIAGKVVGYTLLSLVSLVVLAVATIFIGIRTAPGERLLVRVSLYYAAKYLAAPITVGGIHTNIWSGLVLENVTMHDIEGQECAHIDKLTVKFSLMPLLRNGLHIDSALLEGGRARVRSLKDGRINFAALLMPSQAQPPSPDRSESKFRIEIDNVKATLEARYEPAPGVKLEPVAGLIDVVGAVGIGGGDVTVKIAGLSLNLRGPAPALATANGELVVHDGNVRFSPTHLDVELLGTALKAFVPQPTLRGKYHLSADAQGGLENLAITATLLTPSAPVHVDGALLIGDHFGWQAHVRTSGLDPEKIVVGIPRASLSLDAEGHGDSEGTHVAVASSRIVAQKNEARATGAVEIGKSLHTDLEVDLDAKDLSALHGRGVPKLAGVVSGHARVRYAPSAIKLDTELKGHGLELPSLRVGTFKITAHTENVGGQVLIEANGVRTSDLSLAYTRIQANGDKRSFFVRASSSGSDGTSLDFAARGTPHYGEGPLPTGVDVRLEVLDFDRAGERWHLEPTAKIAYDEELTVSGLRLRSQNQSLSIDGEVDFAKQLVSAKVTGQALDLQRLIALVTKSDRIPHSKLDVFLTAEGPLKKPRFDATLSGTVTRDPERKETEAKVQLQAHLDPRHLTAKSELTLENNHLSLALDLPAELSLPALLRSTLTTRVNLNVKVPLLSRLYDLLDLHPPLALSTLDGQVGLDLTLSGTGRAPVLHVDLAGDELKYGRTEHDKLRFSTHYEAAKLETKLDVELGEQRGALHVQALLPLVLAHLLDGRLALLDRLGRTAPIAGEVSISNLDLRHLRALASEIPLVDAGTLDAKLALSGTVVDPIASLHLTAKGIRSGTITPIDVALSLESARSSTKLDATVTVDKSQLIALQGKAAIDGGALIAGARLRDTRFDATATFPSFELAKLASIVPGLTGKLAGTLHVLGTPAAPTASAHLTVEGLGIGTTRFTAFDLAGSYAGDAATVDLKAKETSGGSLALKAKMALSTRDITGQLTAKALQIDFQSLDDSLPLRRLKGQLDADLQVTGSGTALTSRGRFELTHGVLAISADPRELSELELRLSLQPGYLKLVRLSAKLGSGHFNAEGGATLDGILPKSVDLVAHTKHLPVVQNPIAASLDSKITIHGERKDNRLAGTIRVDDGSARLPKLTNVRNLQSTGELEDYVYVDRRARAGAKRKAKQDASPLIVEIETVIPGPFHVRSQEIQIDLAGKLTIKTRGSEVSLRGDIESTGGRMDLLGKRYDIERIRVGFDGSPVINPSIDVRATRQLIDARITIEVSGTASRPKLRLSSNNPAYDDTKIIAAILSGDPGAKVTDTSLDKKVTGAISGLVVGAIKDQIAPQLPIDVIKVDAAGSGSDYTGLNSTRLEIGKFLSDNIYVSYAHKFGATQIGTRKVNSNEGEFEYRFLRHFALDVVLGDAPSGRSDLFWTVHF